MPNNSISQVSLDDGTGNSTTYDIKDAFAREHIVPTFIGTNDELEEAEELGLIEPGMLIFTKGNTSPSGYPSASQIALSSITGMDADDVQEGIEELKSDLTASNNMPFKFAYDSTSGKYGYITESGGADTFNPFSSVDGIVIATSTDGFENYVFTKQDSGNSGTSYSDGGTYLSIAASGSASSGTYYTHKAVLTFDVIKSTYCDAYFSGMTGGTYRPTYSGSLVVTHEDTTTDTYNFSLSNTTAHFIVQAGDSITITVDAYCPGNWYGRLDINTITFECE